MKNHLAIVALTIFALLSVPAYAHDNPTGMTLKQKCLRDPVSSNDFSNVAWCDGFVYAVLVYDPAIPQGVTVGQLELVLNKYMDEHPEKLNLPAESVVDLAALGAWGEPGK
jgi:Rap1a immunity proteins